jgi:NADH-quinone oxidoreductase subunit M
MDTFLLLLIVVPLAGAVVCALLPNDGRTVKSWALLVSLVTAVFAVGLAVRFPWEGGGSVQFGGGPTDLFHLEPFGFGFSLVADAVSVWLVLLTVLLMPLAIAASFDSIRERQKQYYAWMLVLLAAMIGVFIARDALLFYIFFELTLIPMFFIIGIWGGPERRAAAGKFFLFTFTGSVFLLAGIIYLSGRYSTFDIHVLVGAAQGMYQGASPLRDSERFWLLLAFLAGFAVKVPLFPVHTWLPLAHTEAPTAGSVILAGVLLKLGTYGLYKLAIPIGLLDTHGVVFPAALKLIAVLCLLGIIYGALVAWVQQDIKKLVAYSSVSHLGFCVLGLVALNDIGVEGSVLYMINHGLSTGALFLVIGMIYDRYHTRDINELSGLARRMPRLAFFFVLFALSSIGLPGLNGFVSEFLTIQGAFTSKHLGIGYGAVAATGIVLGAIYMLHMTARVIWGPLKVPVEAHAGHGHVVEDQRGEPPVRDAHGQADAGQAASAGGHGRGTAAAAHDDDRRGADINFREIAVLVPLAVLVVVLGLQPNLVLRTIARPVQSLTRGDHGPPRPAEETLAAAAAGAPIVAGEAAARE